VLIYLAVLLASALVLIWFYRALAPAASTLPPEDALQSAVDRLQACISGIGSGSPPRELRGLLAGAEHLIDSVDAATNPRAEQLRAALTNLQWAVKLAAVAGPDSGTGLAARGLCEYAARQLAEAQD
jgi:hypothetical protein